MRRPRPSRRCSLGRHASWMTGQPVGACGGGRRRRSCLHPDRASGLMTGPAQPCFTVPVASSAAMSLVQRWDPAPLAGKGAWLRGNLVKAIHTGVLGAGMSLPGARNLAAAVGVSRGTVDAVYAQLTDEGFLHQQPRRRPTGASKPGGRPPALTAPTSAAPPPTPGAPDATLFPHRAWAAASRAALNGIAARDLGYPDPSGHPVLRAA